MHTLNQAPQSDADGQLRPSFRQRGITTASVIASKALSTHRRARWPNNVSEALHNHLQRVGVIQLRDGTELSLSQHDNAVHVAEAVFHLHEVIDDFDLLVRVILDPSHNDHLPAHGLGALINWPAVVHLLRDTGANDYVIGMAQSRLQWFLLHCFSPESIQTGELVWTERPPCHFGTVKRWRTFNTAHSGCVAGYLNRRRSGNRYLVSIFGKQYLRSVVTYAAVNGSWPGGNVDHINGVTDEDRPENLRLATTAQNGANQRRPRANNLVLNASSCNGIFRARVKQGSKEYSKSFADIERAAIWADVVSCLVFGRFAATNLECGYLAGHLTQEQADAHALNIDLARSLGVHREYSNLDYGVAMPPSELMRELERADDVIGTTGGHLRNIRNLFEVSDLPEAFL